MNLGLDKLLGLLTGQFGLIVAVYCKLLINYAKQCWNGVVLWKTFINYGNRPYVCNTCPMYVIYIFIFSLNARAQNPPNGDSGSHSRHCTTPAHMISAAPLPTGHPRADKHGTTAAYVLFELSHSNSFTYFVDFNQNEKQLGFNSGVVASRTRRSYVCCAVLQHCYSLSSFLSAQTNAGNLPRV